MVRSAAPPGDQRAPELHLESLGLSDHQLESIARLWRAGTSAVDPAVQYLVGATCGIAYEEVIGHLSEYPIPEIPLPRSQGKHLVDLGCNWGRWSMAAARKGYRVIGVDPQLGAVISARRVARQLGLSAGFVCGDARHLPIRTAQVDTVFSYSVLQHFSEANCVATLKEVRRVMRDGGDSMVQMADALGLRSMHHLARRRFRKPIDFEVRYYAPAALLKMFEENIGASSITPDCYLGLGLQASDRDLFPLPARIAVSISESMKRAAAILPIIVRFADSLYVQSRKTLL